MALVCREVNLAAGRAAARDRLTASLADAVGVYHGTHFRRLEAEARFRASRVQRLGPAGVRWDPQSAPREIFAAVLGEGGVIF